MTDDNEPMDISAMQAQLPDFPDEYLEELRADVYEDPKAFSAHVGEGKAVAFLAALLQEMAERGLFQLEDPKKKPEQFSGSRLFRKSTGCAPLLGHLYLNTATSIPS